MRVGLWGLDTRPERPGGGLAAGPSRAGDRVIACADLHSLIDHVHFHVCFEYEATLRGLSASGQALRWRPFGP